MAYIVNRFKILVKKYLQHVLAEDGEKNKNNDK